VKDEDREFEDKVIEILKKRNDLMRAEERLLRQQVGDELVDIDKMLSKHIFRIEELK
jgi:hypothetical protein